MLDNKGIDLFADRYDETVNITEEAIKKGRGKRHVEMPKMRTHIRQHKSGSLLRRSSQNN